MGTDIRIYAEQRINGHWQYIGEMISNIYYESNPERELPSHPKDLYEIRNYALFAILADMRNDEGYQCIAPRRGIPDDLSPAIQSYFETFSRSVKPSIWLPQDEKQRACWMAYDIDWELRPGWLTLKELLNFPWHETRIQIYARVDERVTHLFHSERAFPFSEWPEGIQCGYSTTYKEDPYCNASWIQTYAEAAGGDFMDLLATFSQRYGASEDVRFVFWFS